MQKKIKKSQMVKMIAAGVATGVVSASAISAVVLAAKPDSRNINNDLVGDPAPTETVYDLAQLTADGVDLGFFPSLPDRDAIVSRLNAINDTLEHSLPSFNDLLIEDIDDESAKVKPGSHSRQYIGEGIVTFKIGTTTHAISDDVTDTSEASFTWIQMPTTKQLMLKVKEKNPTTQINQLECNWVHVDKDYANISLTPADWGTYYNLSAPVNFTIKFVGMLANYIVETNFVFSFPNPTEAEVAKAIMDYNEDSIGSVFTEDDINVSLGNGAATITVEGFEDNDEVIVYWTYKQKTDINTLITTTYLGDDIFFEIPDEHAVINKAQSLNTGLDDSLWQEIIVRNITENSALLDCTSAEDYKGSISVNWDSTAIPAGYLSITSTTLNGFDFTTTIGGKTLAQYLTANPSARILEVPSNITAIANTAFDCNSTAKLPAQINSIKFNTIGDLVIGNNAFRKCSSLVGTLELPSGTKTIGTNAFQNCTGLTNLLALPSTVQSIGNYSFSGTNITGLSISPLMTIVPEYAFSACALLKSVVIPDNITEIQKFAFNECTSITNLSLGTKLQTIGQSAFQKCAKISNPLVLPSTLTTIGNSAFSDCSGLTGALVLPANLTTIGTAAFSMTNFDSFTENATFKRAINVGTGSNVLINGTTFTDTTQAILAFGPLDFSVNYAYTSINASAFYGCKNITSVNFGKAGTTSTNVNTLGNGAFQSCSGINGALDLSNLTSIGTGAFQNCTGITSVTFNNTLTIIKDSAFRGCEKLTGTLTLPTGLVTIEDNAFRFCSSLSGTLTLPTGLNEIKGNAAFSGCKFTDFVDNAYFSKATNLGPDAIVLLNNGTGEFGNTSRAIIASGEIIFPTDASDLTEIGDYAFFTAGLITGDLVIPSNITRIGNRALSYLTNINSIEIKCTDVTPPAGYFGGWSFTGQDSIRSHTLWIPKNANNAAWTAALRDNSANGADLASNWHVVNRDA